MSWFVALPFEAELPLPPAPPGLRLLVREDRHLTIAFLGEVGPDAARAAFAVVTAAAADGRFAVPSTVGLGEVVPLGPARRWSALAARLDEGRAGVEAAMTAVRAAAWAAASAPPDERPPLAHVTLARPGPQASADARSAALAWAASVDLRGVFATLSRVSLYRSGGEAAPGRRFAEVDAAPL